jgi:hypothetical protein
MDKKIYILKNRLRLTGPYTLEKLKEKSFNGNVLVWYDGLSDWTEMELLEPLKEFINKERRAIKRDSFWKRNKFI